MICGSCQRETGCAALMGRLRPQPLAAHLVMLQQGAIQHSSACREPVDVPVQRCLDVCLHLGLLRS